MKKEKVWYDTSYVDSMTIYWEEKLIDITMSCSPEESLEILRSIWKTENKKQRKNLAIMYAAENLGNSIKKSCAIQ